MRISDKNGVTIIRAHSTVVSVGCCIGSRTATICRSNLGIRSSVRWCSNRVLLNSNTGYVCMCPGRITAFITTFCSVLRCDLVTFLSHHRRHEKTMHPTFPNPWAGGATDEDLSIVVAANLTLNVQPQHGQKAVQGSSSKHGAARDTAQTRYLFRMPGAGGRSISSAKTPIKTLHRRALVQTAVEFNSTVRYSVIHCVYLIEHYSLLMSYRKTVQYTKTTGGCAQGTGCAIING